MQLTSLDSAVIALSFALNLAIGFYLMLFGVGNLLFARTALGLTITAASLACLGILSLSLNRRGWGTFREAESCRRQSPECNRLMANDILSD